MKSSEVRWSVRLDSVVAQGLGILFQLGEDSMAAHQGERRKRGEVDGTPEIEERTLEEEEIEKEEKIESSQGENFRIMKQKE